MTRSPKWSMKDLINHYGISHIDFMNLCKKRPLPEPVVFKNNIFYKNKNTNKQTQWYDKKELLLWYRKVTES